jgi:hypothetical protein
MVTCYEDFSYRWTSTGTTSMLQNNTYPTLNPYAISLLLEWHRNDPVSEKEIDRNNAVHDIQNNRNPFIDFPQLAEYIWGDKMNKNWSASTTGVKNAKITYTISPNPAKDIIQIKNEVNVDYCIYSIFGKKMKSGTVVPNGTIWVNDLNNGMYLAYFAKEEKKQIEKLIVNR